MICDEYFSIDDVFMGRLTMSSVVQAITLIDDDFFKIMPIAT